MPRTAPHPGGDFLAGSGDTRSYSLCFLAENKEEVQACYEAGLEAGGRDNGAPDYRSEHPIYYAAFVIDPDGNNIEVVCHKE